MATDWTSSLSGANRDAAAAITSLFQRYGLGSLAGQIVGFVQQGYGQDTITMLLEDTPAYKQRFAANAMRQKKGLSVLSPAEYIAAEESYRAVLAQAGVPVGFYDQQTDFQNFIANDVSPTELQTRVNVAAEAVRRAPPETQALFSQWYHTGDMIAYALDPTRAAPLIEQRIKAAEAGAMARQQGADLTQANAEFIGGQGLTTSQIQAGTGLFATESRTTQKLNEIYGQDVSQEDLVQSIFADNGQAMQKRNRLASQERAAFKGSSAAGGTSLNREKAGSV